MTDDDEFHIVSEPDDGDDANEAEVLANFEAQFETTDETDPVVNVTELSDRDLLERIDDIRTKLYQMGEMLKPVTQQARDLHSERAALLIEQSQRGLGGR